MAILGKTCRRQSRELVGWSPGWFWTLMSITRTYRSLVSNNGQSKATILSPRCILIIIIITMSCTLLPCLYLWLAPKRILYILYRPWYCICSWWFEVSMKCVELYRCLMIIKSRPLPTYFYNMLHWPRPICYGFVICMCTWVFVCGGFIIIIV